MTEHDTADAVGAGRGWMALGAVLAGLAVVCGALAAHVLDRFFVEQYAGETRLVAGQEVPRAVKYLADFRTGAEYQMYHALGLVAVGLALRQTPQKRSLHVAAGLLFAGIVLFSGSLYLLTLTGQTWLGAVTPFGGTAFILGWLVLAAAVVKTR